MTVAPLPEPTEPEDITKNTNKNMKNCDATQGEPGSAEDMDKLLDPLFFNDDKKDFDLPPRPREELWTPKNSPEKEAGIMYNKLPRPLRRWIDLYEPTM